MSPAVNEMLAVTKTLELEADPEQVWEALTDPGQLGAWFPDSVDIDSTSPGSRGWFVWENHGRYAFEIKELEPHGRLVWRWARDPDVELDETPTTLVEWTIEARPGGGTVVNLRETGFGSEEQREGNDEGWDKELAELRELLATA